MRYRFMLLAALAGLVLAVFGPMRPAGADDGVNCYEEIVIDPTYCDDDVPPEPPPPAMGRPTMGPMPVPAPPPPPTPPPGPQPPPAPPTANAICLVTRETSFIGATDRDGAAYGFEVGAEYCVDPNTGLILRVTPLVPQVRPRDGRVIVISQPSAKDVTVVPPGGSVTEANVFFQIDVRFAPNGNTGPKKEYHHEYGLRITTRPLRVNFPPPMFTLTREIP